MIGLRRLLSWLSGPPLEQRLAAYRAQPTGLPGEAEARRRARDVTTLGPMSQLSRPDLGQVGSHPLSGGSAEAVGRSEPWNDLRDVRTLSPVLERPESFEGWNREATARAMREAGR